MAFKTIVDISADVTIALGGINRKTGKANPKQIEGYFLGKKQVKSPKAKSGFAYLYTFQTDSGNVGVWGKTDLDRKMEGVVPGTMVRATHSGMVKTPNGEMYQYKVEVDAENTIEVTGSVGTTETQNEGFDGGDETEDDGDEIANIKDLLRKKRVS